MPGRKGERQRDREERPPLPADPPRGDPPSQPGAPAARDSASRAAADGRPPAAASCVGTHAAQGELSGSPRGLGAPQARGQGPPLLSGRAGPALALCPALGPGRGLRRGRRPGLGLETVRGHRRHLRAAGRTARVAAEDRRGRRPVVGASRVTGPEGGAGSECLGGGCPRGRCPRPAWRRPCPFGWGRERRGAWRMEPQRRLAAPLAGNLFRRPPGSR